MARERKLFTVNKNAESMSGVIIPGNDIPMHVETLTSESGTVMLNLTNDAEVEPKAYKSGIEDPNQDHNDLRHDPLIRLGQQGGKVYFSVWTSANTNNFGANTVDLGYSEISMPLNANLSLEFAKINAQIQGRFYDSPLTANTEYANVGLTLTTDDMKAYFDDEEGYGTYDVETNPTVHDIRIAEEVPTPLNVYGSANNA